MSVTANQNIPYNKIIEIIDLVITIVGDVKLSEAKTWAEVEANAEELRGEGHDAQPAEKSNE
jgi:hypothetical protein